MTSSCSQIWINQKSDRHTCLPDVINGDFFFQLQSKRYPAIAIPHTTTPRHATSYATPRHTMPSPIPACYAMQCLSYHTITCHERSGCCAMPFHSIQYHAIPCHAIPYNATYAMLSHTIPCHTMSTMSWYAMPCHAMP